MELAAGTLVTASVRLVERLGAGGMGEVWIAHHAGLSIQVAVKFILQDDPTARARFKREASLAAQIQSSHAVRIFDHGETEDGTMYIIMELLQGESLSERLARGPMGLGEAVPIVQQIALVLSEAHRLGVVHRDIKPSNIFLATTPEGLIAKVLDFGLAKQVLLGPGENVTATGTLIGSPRFLSPELLSDATRVDHRADLWALSAVVYEMLTGCHAFEGTTLGAILVSVMNKAYRPPSVTTAGISPALDAWFARAFAEDLTQRFQSAEEIASSLARLAESPSALTASATSVASSAERRSTPWRGLALGAGALLVIGTGLVVAFQMGASSKAETEAKVSKSRAKAGKKKKAKKPARRSTDPTWTPGTGSPHHGSEKCPYAHCKPHDVETPARFEPRDGVAPATKFVSEHEKSVSLVTVSVPESKRGLVDLERGGGVVYRFSVAGGSAAVFLTHGALMLEKDEGIPAGFGDAPPPKCGAGAAYKRAVKEGFSSSSDIAFTYLLLPAFPGKPARAVWQLYANDEPMRLWRMDGNSCDLVQRP